MNGPDFQRPLATGGLRPNVEVPPDRVDVPPDRMSVLGGGVQVPADRVERPSVAEIYERTFGPSCARVALDAYAAALKSDPAHEFQAVMAGHAAGRRCQDELFSRLTNFFPQRRAGPTLKL